MTNYIPVLRRPILTHCLLMVKLLSMVRKKIVCCRLLKWFWIQRLEYSSSVPVTMGLFWNHKFNDRHNDHGQLYSPFYPDYIQLSKLPKRIDSKITPGRQTLKSEAVQDLRVEPSCILVLSFVFLYNFKFLFVMLLLLLHGQEYFHVSCRRCPLQVCPG